MAFRQPTYHAPQRLYTPQTEGSHQTTTPSQPLEESQEWILFSPTAPSTTDRTYTTSTDRTRIRTAGHSRISDLGSLDTAARSDDYEEASAVTEGLGDDDNDGEDGELDSLDSHLHEFGAESSVYRGARERAEQRRDSGEEGEASGTVLPTHDGLGSFRVDPAAMGEEVQQHLYAFERFNPRRVKRRRESADLGTVLAEVDGDRAAEVERTRRIEAWRMEQSRLLVDEIQRETRRRKQSMSSERRTSVFEKEQEETATLSNVDVDMEEETNPQENESFWNRITKRVIRDLMGIDDDLLSIIFGESLPSSPTSDEDTLSSTPRATYVVPSLQFSSSTWEYRLLDRIARELGILVNQISDHPGAFNTYLEQQSRDRATPLPYAGLPVIPEGTRTSTPALGVSTSQSQTQQRNQDWNSPETPTFHPTLQSHPQAIPISIPQSPSHIRSSTSLASPQNDSTPRPSNPLSQQPITREEWERDLDIKMVFRYLRSRFSRGSLSTGSPGYSGLGELDLNLDADARGAGIGENATRGTAADIAARAARVRSLHPLVTSTPSNPTYAPRQSRPTYTPAQQSLPKIRRPSSSCASSRMSGKGAARRNSGSSRHYWDFGHGGSVGGSLGSAGSLVVSTGGMGSWGEV